jgi:VWFA-related protein
MQALRFQGCCSLPLLIAGFAVAELPAFSQQAPVFRSVVDLIELDVSVLDSNRRPVRGLTRGDFIVLEDGKVQDIGLFEAIDVAPKSTVTSLPRRGPFEVATNDQQVTRLWVIVVDDALTPADPYARATAVNVTRDLVASLGEGDQAAVVFTANSRRAQDFTADRTRLLQALDQFSPGWATWKPRRSDAFDPDWQFQTGALLTLRNVLETLQLLPHYRKAIVWVSPGIDLSVPAAGPGDLDGSIADLVARYRVVEVTREIVGLARQTNVPLYAIHPCGLVPEGTGGSCGLAVNGRVFLRQVTQETGGFAVVDTNDYREGLQQLVAENDSYYLLGYYPTNARTDGRLRQLEVKVNRPDVFVRTRNSYSAPKEAATRPTTVHAALAAATAVPIAVIDTPLRAVAASVAPAAGGKKLPVAIALGLRTPAHVDGHVQPAITTDLQIAAYTTEGKREAFERRTVTAAPGLATDHYEALIRIDLPPGRFRLRIAAHQQGTDKTGTVMVDVDVPNLSSARPVMSDVLIGAEPGWPSAPKGLFAGLLPFAPTSRRTFSQMDRVNAFCELYQYSDPPMSMKATVRIVGALGRPVGTETVTVSKELFLPSRFGRKGTFQYSLPLQQLEPGEYLAIVEVSDGTTSGYREVRFEVGFGPSLARSRFEP